MTRISTLDCLSICGHHRSLSICNFFSFISFELSICNNICNLEGVRFNWRKLILDIYQAFFFEQNMFLFLDNNSSLQKYQALNKETGH